MESPRHPVAGGHPVAGVDYPRTFQEFDTWFGSETACREYIRRLRWPDGFVCPHCAAVGEPWGMSRRLLRCRACDRQVSLTAGTVLQGHAQAVAAVVSRHVVRHQPEERRQCAGPPAGARSGQLRTAWTWVHKLRRAMVRPGRDCLSGEIEIDETYVGGPEEGRRGRQTEDKAVVVVAAREKRSWHWPHPSAPRRRRIGGQPFVRAIAVPGSTIHTDGWSGYARLPTLGYQHRVRRHQRWLRFRPTWSCPAFTTLPRCSNDG